MKVFVFRGGLGNQIFEYFFYKKQLEINPSVKYIFPEKCHNGFEINKWFDVVLHKASVFDVILYKILRKLDVSCLIADKDSEPEADNYFVLGYFQDKRYFNGLEIKFKTLQLSESNKHYLNLIDSCESVAIHIRRGDYLQPPFDEIYGGICTEEYYKSAIDIVKRSIKNPVFFIFSNDKEWIKDNLHIDNAIYVDCNSGMNSPLDMFLMTHSKANIIANSSFSFWGAYLNRFAKLVVYPKRWYKSKYKVPDIFPSDWLGI